MAAAGEGDQGEAGGPSADRGAGRKRRATDQVSLIGIVAAVIGGGIGVLSFVAFFGAAILWVRMDQAKIPSNEAVAVIPKSVLVTTGAGFLVPSLLAALGFTVLLYLVDALTEYGVNRNLREQKKDLARLEEELKGHREVAEAAAEKVDEAVEQAEKIEEIAGKAAGTMLIGDAVADNIQEAAQQAHESAKQLREEAVPVAKSEDEMIQAKLRLQKKRAANMVRIRQRQTILRLGAIASVSVLGAAAALVAFSVNLPPERSVVLAILMAALIAVCLTLLARTDSFPIFALATFVAVAVFSGFLTYYRTVDDPKVEPAAVLRSHGPPVFGYFIAQTSDRVYLATRIPTSNMRLDAIPREEVTDLTVAALESKADAYQEARQLAFAICRVARERYGSSAERVERTGGGKATSTAEVPCTESDLQRLRAGLDRAGGGGGSSA